MTAHRHIVPPVQQIGESFATIVERVMERDRAFFAEHPGAQSCLRPCIPGEFSPDSLAAIGLPLPSQDAWIVVRQVAPGVRNRGLVTDGRPA